MRRLCLLIFLTCVGSILNCVAVVQEFYWRDYIQGDIPYDAIEGGIGKYIGQVYFHGHGLLPAAIYPHRAAAVAVFGNRQNLKENIKILCSSDPSKFYWAPVNFNKTEEGQMRNVVKGGFQDGYNIFIGIAKHEDEYKIGKVIDLDSELKGLWVWNTNGSKVRIMDFHVLKFNYTIYRGDEYAIFKP